MANDVEKRETLDALRAELDDIDCKVHDLLMDRAQTPVFGEHLFVTRCLSAGL